MLPVASLAFRTDRVGTELSNPAPPSIRTSLKASTIDGGFATIFSNITGGVLLSNFLVDLDISTTAIALVSATPMLMNLLQPLGAHLSDRSHSRYLYGLITYGISRLLWLLLALGVISFNWDHHAAPQSLLLATLVVILAAEVLAALGSASWLSWMAALVPSQLRGRYFGFRNSISSLTALICLPLAGWGVAHWPGGSLQGYGIMLFLGVAAGLISLWVQSWMHDLDPRSLKHAWQDQLEPEASQLPHWWQPPFSRFLLYWGLWTFSVNLSAPFFNIYLLDNLGIGVSWVTFYNSLTAAAGLLMLLVWGKLSDRTGNRPLLVLVGILVALTPLLWLGIGADSWSVKLWLPLLFILIGCTAPAIDLCSNNLQIAIAPPHHQASYFAISAAIAGGCGALGTLMGGGLSELPAIGGLPGIFVLSSGLRLLALLSLFFVHEPCSHSLVQVMQALSGGSQAIGPQLELHPVELEEN